MVNKQDQTEDRYQEMDGGEVVTVYYGGENATPATLQARRLSLAVVSGLREAGRHHRNSLSKQQTMQQSTPVLIDKDKI